MVTGCFVSFGTFFQQVKEFGKGTTTGGKGKGAASAKPPQFHEVCEQVKPLMDQSEPIPPSLMAKLLKFKLLHVKQKDLERREEERKVNLNVTVDLSTVFLVCLCERRQNFV